jgi:hypothetical protein
MDRVTKSAAPIHYHQNDAENPCLLKRLPLEHGIDVVHIDTRPDHPVPSGNAGDIGNLRRCCRCPRLDPVVTHEAAALGAGDVAECCEHRHAIGITNVEHALADPVGQVGMPQQNAVQAIDPEIVGAVIAQHGNGIERRLLCRVFRHGAACHLGGECHGNAGCGIDKVFGLQLTVMKQFRP